MLTSDLPRTLSIGPAKIEIRTTAAESDGHAEIFEFTIPPNFPGPGRHVHDRCEELFTILDGTAEFEIGGARVLAKPGDTVIARRGETHDWHNAGKVPLRLVITFTPAAGMAAYFVELVDAMRRGVPSDAERQALWRRHDIRPA